MLECRCVDSCRCEENPRSTDATCTCALFWVAASLVGEGVSAPAAQLQKARNVPSVARGAADNPDSGCGGKLAVLVGLHSGHLHDDHQQHEDVEKAKHGSPIPFLARTLICLFFSGQ